ncbi:unnamed protein product [Moneuplotes crassus]|uniref:Uncharacterized protein n=1 Tax=Euplotes crassus TaxID=5936 RepID=A0AAD1XEZ4_EUPCR|nr:unnamed protein product [Moneuplotes crassus]
MNEQEYEHEQTSYVIMSEVKQKEIHFQMQGSHLDPLEESPANVYPIPAMLPKQSFKLSSMAAGNSPHKRSPRVLVRKPISILAQIKNVKVSNEKEESQKTPKSSQSRGEQ